MTVADVIVEVPKEFYLEKDFLDHRYHAKRLAYLQVLQRHITRADWVANVSSSSHHADIRKPCLLVKAKKFDDVCLRVILTAPSDTFPAARLHPNKSNLRHLEGNEGERAFSPHYNQSIMEDLFVTQHMNYLQDAAAEIEFLEDACVLLKVWAVRRGILGAPDGFTGFILSMLMTHFVTTGGKLNPLMDARQLVKGALTLLSDPNVFAAGFCAGGPSNLTQWKRAFPLVFLGPCGNVNIAARVSKSAIAEFTHEAALSVAILERGERTAFEQVYLASMCPAVRYDMHLHIGLMKDDIAPSGACDDDVVTWRGVEARAYSIASRALGSRSKLIRVQHQPFVNGSDVRPVVELIAPSTKKRKSPVGASVTIAENLCKLWVGVVLDPENASRLVDIGPSSDDDTLAKEFREFWGDRAELRRFKDGRICESVVWDTIPVNKRHHIPALAIEHTLKRNLGMTETVDWSCSLLDPALQGKGTLPEDNSKESSPTALLQSLDRLTKRLKALKEVPLKVINVQPMSSAFRGTDPFPPQPHQLAFGAGIGLGRTDEDIPVCPKPLDVLVQLEGSGRWPENHIAINKTKSAMALKIAEQLRSSYGTPSIVAEEAIDILHEGFAFRMHINSSASGSNNESAERNLIMRAAHAGIVATIAARFPVFGPAVQVAKRWIAGHMLSPHLVDDVVELLVGYLFLHPGSALPPTSREVAFLRFLDLLACHPWNVLPLFVDPEEEVTSEIMQTLEKKMDDPHSPAMCIWTPYDGDGDVWTHNRPVAVVLKRAQALALRASERLKALLQGSTGGSQVEAFSGALLGDNSAWESIFTPALTHYDIVLKVRRNALPFPDNALFSAKQVKRRLVKELGVDPESFEQAEHGSRKGLQLAKIPEKVLNRGPDKAREAMMIGFDPLSCFLRDAERRFGGTALFFADKYGGDLIGVALKPKAQHYDAQLSASLADFDPLGDFTPPAPPEAEDILDELLFFGNGFVQDAFGGRK